MWPPRILLEPHLPQAHQRVTTRMQFILVVPSRETDRSMLEDIQSGIHIRPRKNNRSPWIHWTRLMIHILLFLPAQEGRSISSNVMMIRLKHSHQNYPSLHCKERLTILKLHLIVELRDFHEKYHPRELCSSMPISQPPVSQLAQI